MSRRGSTATQDVSWRTPMIDVSEILVSRGREGQTPSEGMKFPLREHNRRCQGQSPSCLEATDACITVEERPLFRAALVCREFSRASAPEAPSEAATPLFHSLPQK